MGGACSAYGGEERRVRGFWWGKLTERDHLEDPGVVAIVVLKLNFRKWDLDRTGSGQRQVARTFECGKESSDSIKCGELLD